jgi:hypothetical protein
VTRKDNEEGIEGRRKGKEEGGTEELGEEEDSAAVFAYQQGRANHQY